MKNCKKTKFLKKAYLSLLSSCHKQIVKFLVSNIFYISFTLIINAGSYKNVVIYDTLYIYIFHFKLFKYLGK